MTKDNEISELTVGNLPTLNQDEYPDLKEWWNQIRNTEGVFARVYANEPEEAHQLAIQVVEACNNYPKLKEENEKLQAEKAELLGFVKACKQFGVVDATNNIKFDEWIEQLLTKYSEGGDEG